MWLLAGMTGLSQLHRASLSAIGPDVAHDLGLDPAALGAVGAAFFVALLVAQIPVGIALDRIGPRRLVAGLAVLAVAGAALEAQAATAAQLWGARFLTGLGCAASFMSAVVLCARWEASPHPPGPDTAAAKDAGRQASTRMLTRVFALSQAGLVLAGAPLAFAALWLGWRGALLGTALLTAAMALLWWHGVRDAPPGHARAAPRETLGQALRGQFTVWATPGLPRLLAIHLVGYAAMATLLGVWAAPYLADVHGLDARARGLVLLAMVCGLPAGLLLLPRIEAMFGRTRTVLAGALAAAACLSPLAAVAGLPLGGAVAALVALCVVSAYPVLVVAENRALFPDHMAGRAATTLNLAQVLGGAALPVLVGGIVGLWPEVAGVRPEAAYRAGFAAVALCVLAGALGYWRLRRA